MAERLDHERICRVYIKIRDARRAATAEYEKKDAEFKQQLASLEAALLKALGRTKSMRTEDNITFYKELDIQPQVKDWDAFYAWIKETDNFEALERRVKKTFIKDYREQHKDDEESNPPGVSVIEEYKVIVRKGN